MAKKRKGTPVNGWVLFNKPTGMTSTQAVGFIKRIFNAQKAGHGGTLDPLADGVLPIALGEATKLMNHILLADKTYVFTVKFGSATDTDDSEGEVIHHSKNRPTEEQIRQALPLFTGHLQQLPPIYSAIKKDGQAAYKKARAGEEVEREPRAVTVHKLELLRFNGENAQLSAHVSKGTYVRAIARDLGEELGCYGHITQLQRTQSGPFSLQDCVDKPTLEAALVESQEVGTQNQVDEPTTTMHIPTPLVASLQNKLQPLAAVLDDIPAYVATPAEIAMLKRGNTFHRIHLSPGVMKVLDRKEQLVSLIEVSRVGKVSILRNFNVA